jgi:hypothetical protein
MTVGCSVWLHFELVITVYTRHYRRPLEIAFAERI